MFCDLPVCEEPILLLSGRLCAANKVKDFLGTLSNIFLTELPAFHGLHDLADRRQPRSRHLKGCACSC